MPGTYATPSTKPDDTPPPGPASAPANPATYDPTSATPYVSPTAPTQPEVTAPPPPPLTDTSGPNTGGRPPVFGGGARGTAGSIAYLGDSILRGAMRGRERAQQMQVIKAKRLMDGFTYAKQQADSQILDMVQKPEMQEALQKRQAILKSKTPEDTSSLTDSDKKLLAQFDQAHAASDSAWQGLNQMRNQYLFGGQGKGKGKGKKSQEAEDPATMAMSSDPKVKLQGIAMIQQRLGNPINYQVKDLLSKITQQQPALAHQQTLDKLQAQFDTLNAIPEDKLTPEQKSQKSDTLRQIEEQKAVAAPYGKNLDKKITTFVGADNKEHVVWQRADQSTYETVGSEVRAPASTLKPRQAWSKDERGRLYSVNLDPKTNQPIPGTENYSLAPPNSILPTTVKTSEFTFTDDDGNVFRVPTTTVATHEGGGAGTGAGPGAKPVAAVGPSAGAGTKAGAGTGTGAGTGAGANAGASTHPPVAGARPIGHTLSADDKKVHSALIQTSEKARSLTELLNTNEAYMQSIKADPSKATPRQDLSLVVAAVRAMNPGSVRLPQKELELEMKAGSWGDRIRRAYDIASSGLLPNDQREDLFNIIRNETTNFGKDVAADWQKNFPNRPLP